VAEKITEADAGRAAEPNAASADAGANEGLASARAAGWLRGRRPELTLVAVAAGCVIGFALWLDGQLRPALDRRASDEQATEVLRERLAPCAPRAVVGNTSWCGAISVVAPQQVVAMPVPVVEDGRPSARSR
jgi:hypothetical protein